MAAFLRRFLITTIAMITTPIRHNAAPQMMRIKESIESLSGSLIDDSRVVSTDDDVVVDVVSCTHDPTSETTVPTHGADDARHCPDPPNAAQYLQLSVDSMHDVHVGFIVWQAVDTVVAAVETVEPKEPAPAAPVVLPTPPAVVAVVVLVVVAVLVVVVGAGVGLGVGFGVGFGVGGAGVGGLAGNVYVEIAFVLRWGSYSIQSPC
eukprot:TRINITY_DN9054_c0_g1_i1.p2 TRINITY_DN9054_c0_g1~~TRINITY_DN9054_c0_g1_i1.p2  ORF type:complete len:206 (-),score=21.32 TRINITY_DN9054_c0_g1_i1:378-995(-)